MSPWRLRTIEHVGDLEPAWDVGGAMRFTRAAAASPEVHTDAGITGIGPGMDPALLPAVRRLLVGADPFDDGAARSALQYYVRRAPIKASPAWTSLCGTSSARRAGSQLYKLWGGGRDKVPAYASMVRLSTIEGAWTLARRLAGRRLAGHQVVPDFATMAGDIALMDTRALPPWATAW